MNVNVHKKFGLVMRYVKYRTGVNSESLLWSSCSLSLTLAPSSPPTGTTDNANVSFVTYKGDYYVSTETNAMHKVDPETLEATKKVT